MVGVKIVVVGSSPLGQSSVHGHGRQHEDSLGTAQNEHTGWVAQSLNEQLHFGGLLRNHSIMVGASKK
jgi:hypothetical protein